MVEASQVADQLPYLRRYARAVTGSQVSGDAFVRATLEALVADKSIILGSTDARVGLYGVFQGIWSSAQIEVPAVDDVDHVAQKAHDRLARLTPRSRQALLLTTLEDFSTEQAGAILQASVGEVEALNAAAREEISQQLTANILIIEDEAMIAADLEDIVVGMGHSVIGTATTHKEALELVENSPPGLVLADVQLADGSSGIDAVNDILLSFDVPVIFITAYPDRLLTGERPEPTFLIPKPFKTDVVQSTVSQALFFEVSANK